MDPSGILEEFLIHLLNAVEVISDAATNERVIPTGKKLNHQAKLTDRCCRRPMLAASLCRVLTKRAHQRMNVSEPKRALEQGRRNVSFAEFCSFNNNLKTPKMTGKSKLSIFGINIGMLLLQFVRKKRSCLTFM